ncbi:ankyrin repeat-containing domain protein [Chlamydoabsidia padenii]|nr:ankyrin repeat-containing domain protein [Chlamydoabsidia padenii]
MSTPHKKTIHSSSSSRTPNDLILHYTRKDTGPSKKHQQRVGTTNDRSAIKSTTLKNFFVNKKEQDELMAACSAGDVDKVKQLLMHTQPPLNPDRIRDSKLRSPLLIACASGKADLVRLLVKFGADVNNPVGDIVGNSPLDLAVVSNNVDTVLALLESGATIPRPIEFSKYPTGSHCPIPIPHRLGRSPLDLARSRLDLIARYNHSQNNDFYKQVVQIIKLLKYFAVKVPQNENTCMSAPAEQLDELVTKLSSIEIKECTHEHGDDLIKDLDSIISRLRLA